jgi:hypothetical protein
MSDLEYRMTLGKKKVVIYIVPHDEDKKSKDKHEKHEKHEKTCSRCKKTRDLEKDFYYNKRNKKYQNPCKKCIKELYEEKKKKHTEKEDCPPPEKKTCTNCGETKPGTEFYYNRNRRMFFPECKVCTKMRSAEQRKKKNPDDTMAVQS